MWWNKIAHRTRFLLTISKIINYVRDVRFFRNCFKDTDEVMWLDDIDDRSISSDGNSASLMGTKLLSSSQQKPWSTEEINLALYRLPVGAIAHSIISTIQGETLDNALEEVRNYNLSGLTLTDRKLSIPDFANR